MTAPTPAPRLLMYHKPKGCTVTRADELGQTTVFDLMPDWVREERWMPIGRLDKDSKGLLLFSKDSRWMRHLTKPGAVEKTYEIWVRGWVTKENLKAAVTGVPSPVGILTAKSVEVLGGGGPKTRLKVVLVEGKNREIRRMFLSFKDAKTGKTNKVMELKRVSIGKLSLDILPGTWRFLTPAEEKGLLGC